MYVIVGLGNPEPEYSRTRHNMGFEVINNLIDEYKIEMNRIKFKAIYGVGKIGEEKIVLVKPQTYMNLSGYSVQEFVNFYKISLDELIVIYDDMDIDKGICKIRKKGGPGSHNGMKSIVNSIGTEEFIRIRVGIGKATYKDDIINHVISKITDGEYKELEQGIKRASQAVKEIIKNGIDSSMNKYN